jgi:hypothetical protein
LKPLFVQWRGVQRRVELPNYGDNAYELTVWVRREEEEERRKRLAAVVADVQELVQWQEPPQPS